MPPCHGGGHGFESRTHRDLFLIVSLKAGGNPANLEVIRLDEENVLKTFKSFGAWGFESLCLRPNHNCFELERLFLKFVSIANLIRQRVLMGV